MNPRLKDIRRLRTSKGRRSGRLLLEGPHLIARAVELGLTFETLLATPEAQELHRELLGRCPLEATTVEPALLDELADADSPRGLLGVVTARCDSRAGAAGPTRWLCLDGIQDPGNLGALARSVRGCGAGMILSGTCASPGHARALRASAGALLDVPLRQLSPHQGLEQPELDGLPDEWLALVPAAGENLFEAELPASGVLVVGAEGPGLSAAFADRCARRLTIPVADGVESLNAVVAASIALFHWAHR